MLKKIVVIGPESTGKSTLCQMLANQYQTAWVKEYAREYLLMNGTAYSFENLLDIAKGQIALEDEALHSFANKSGVPETTDPNSPFTIDDSPFPIPHSPIFVDTPFWVSEIMTTMAPPDQLNDKRDNQFYIKGNTTFGQAAGVVFGTIVLLFILLGSVAR